MQLTEMSVLWWPPLPVPGPAYSAGTASTQASPSPRFCLSICLARTWQAGVLRRDYTRAFESHREGGHLLILVGVVGDTELSSDRGGARSAHGMLTTFCCLQRVAAAYRNTCVRVAGGCSCMTCSSPIFGHRSGCIG